MSWQGNECFVVGIEDVYEECSDQMLEAMSAMLVLYGEKGDGWYLLGNMYGNDEEEDFGPFEPTSCMGGPLGCFCWMPNPFMAPGVLAMRIANPHDLLDAAFECWDCGLDVVAYAGDGDEPLEKMEVYGETYDMRPSTTCASAA